MTARAIAGADRKQEVWPGWEIFQIQCFFILFKYTHPHSRSTNITLAVGSDIAIFHLIVS
jgi:hypothetical protein